MKNLCIFLLLAVTISACGNKAASLAKTIESSYIGTLSLSKDNSTMDKSKAIVNRDKDTEDKTDFTIYIVSKNKTLTATGVAKNDTKFDVPVFTFNGNSYSGNGTLKGNFIEVNLLNTDDITDKITYMGSQMK